MDTHETGVTPSGSTAAKNTGSSVATVGLHSADLSENQHVTNFNPTQSLLDSLATSGSAASRYQDHSSNPKPRRRNFVQKPSKVNRIALAAEIKADIRLRFKLIDATFENLPLAKTLAAVQILTKLANRTVKFGMQDVSRNELNGVKGKLVFSPFVVQAYAPQKTQVPHQLVNASAYELVPELVNLSGVKQGGNILLAICHFYNVAVTRTGIKKKIAKFSSELSGELHGNAPQGSTLQRAELVRQRKLFKKLHVYLDAQFPKLITLFDVTSKSRDDRTIAEMMDSDFFLYIIGRIVRHDVIKENDASGRIDLNSINDVVVQAKREISGTGSTGNVPTARPAHLRNANLNAVVSGFIAAYVKMERNFFRECRVRARLVLLERVCCLALLVKFKIPGYSVKIGVDTTITHASTLDNGCSSPQSPADSTNDEFLNAVDDHPAWFEKLPKTKCTDRVKLAGFDDCILGAEQGYPQQLPSYTEIDDKSCQVPKSLRDENRNVFKKYQEEHPEFTLSFKFVKFVVSAPNTNDVLRSSDFANAPTVGYTSQVDLLVVARDYLVELLGCTSWPQLLAVHEKVMYSVISFARSLLAVLRDYIEDPSDDSDDSEAPEVNDKAHLQMFFNTCNAKNVRPVQVGNVAGVFGLKQGLPEAPQSADPSNTAFIATLHTFFDTKSLKTIAGKICIGRKEYDNGIVDVTRIDGSVVDEVATEPAVEEPMRKRVRLTFDDDSDADDSD